MIEPPEEAAGSRIDSWIRPFFDDSTLWPVMIVAIAIFVTMGTAMLLIAVRERNLFATAAGVLVFWMSVDIVVRDRRKGRFGLASRCVANRTIGAVVSQAKTTALGTREGKD